MNEWHLKRAIRVLQADGVIAYPTEAVFGLGCLPHSHSATTRICTMKRRPVRKGLILVASREEQIRRLVDWTRVSRRAVLDTWPGPVTWVLPATDIAPRWITGGQPGIAVRISSHPVVRALCDAAGPIVSTSANPANRPPARCALQVRVYFRSEVDFIVPGRVGGSARPTEIRDGLHGRILRKGG